MLQQPPNLSEVSKDKIDIMNMTFSMSIHILRAFFLELLDKIKDHPNVNKFKKRLDVIMPQLDPGGFRLTFNNKVYSLMYQQCDQDYDLNNQINKIPNLNKLNEGDVQKLIKEIDIAASSVPCVHQKYVKRDDFMKLLGDVFNALDQTLSQEDSDAHKDYTLKIDQYNRTYQMNEPDGIKFGLYVNVL